MSFGRLSDIIESIEKELDSIIYTSTGKKPSVYLDQEIVNKHLVSIYNNQKNIFPELDFKLVQDIFTRLFTTKFEFNKTAKFDNGTKCFRNLDTDKKFDLLEIDTKLIKIPKKYAKLEKHFQVLFNTPQPEQRTPAWYDFRYTRVTASDTATALDLNPYEPVENFIVKKCDPNFPFLDNKFVHHGKKYEPTATMVYEHIYNSKVTEFGALPSIKYPYLAASPDGICSKATLDNKFSNMLGTMLEIKCPYVRPIKTHGEIEGGICPHYYFCQVQQQLECCELDNCDFWQCQLEEYNTRDEYLKDTTFKSKLTIGTNSESKEIDPLITRGCIIQLGPRVWESEFEGDERVWKSTYLYPPRLDMTISEYDDWVIKTTSNWTHEFPELYEKYYFDKVIYWKLPMSHNVTIVRDKKWFEDILPVVNFTWAKVDYYRKHPEELDFIKKIAEKRKKFYRFKTTFELYKVPKINIDIIEHDILFLNDINEKIKSLTKEESSVNESCDFVD
jgi:putative phage-type endonuclease